MSADPRDTRKADIETAMIDAADYNALRQRVATLEQKLRESESVCGVMRHALRELKVRIKEAHFLLNSEVVSWTSHPGPWRDARDKWNRECEDFD